MGFYLKAVFPSRNLGLMRIFRSRFKQSKKCSFISRIYVLRGFVNILGDSFSQWISEILRNKKWCGFNVILELEFEVKN